MEKTNSKHTKKNIILRWIDNNASEDEAKDIEGIDWLRVIPFILMHLACFFVISVGWSPVAVWVAGISYFVRMFAITAFYHRYFSHKAFKTGRVCQFLFAVLGATATQRGPIWWAAHHRRHHCYSDQGQDVHSPRKGFIWSHMGWFLSLKNFQTREPWVKDLVKYPELCWLDRFDIVVPILYAFSLWVLGDQLAVFYPELNTNGWQMLIWGYFISSIVLVHCTLMVNSLAHLYGTRRFDTGDDSCNNAFLALISLGEGWHNNHHHYPVSARQGFYWWEIDISYYLLRLMAFFGLIWDLKGVPPKRLLKNRLPQEQI